MFRIVYLNILKSIFTNDNLAFCSRISVEMPSVSIQKRLIHGEEQKSRKVNVRFMLSSIKVLTLPSKPNTNRDEYFQNPNSLDLWFVLVLVLPFATTSISLLHGLYQLWTAVQPDAVHGWRPGPAPNMHQVQPKQFELLKARSRTDLLRAFLRVVFVQFYLSVLVLEPSYYYDYWWLSQASQVCFSCGC